MRMTAGVYEGRLRWAEALGERARIPSTDLQHRTRCQAGTPIVVVVIVHPRNALLGLPSTDSLNPVHRV